MKSKKRKIILILVSLLLLFPISYSLIGIRDYFAWIRVKRAVALGGYPWQCGIYQMGMVQPGCTETNYGCTCKLCDALCDESTQITFAGQPGCGMTYACIGPDVIPSGMPLMTTSQAIIGATSNLVTGNAVLGTQTFAANRVEKAIDAFKYIIAGFKEGGK